MQWRRIRDHLSLELQALAFCHDGNAVISQISAHQNRVACLSLAGGEGNPAADLPEPCGVDEEPVSATLFHDFRVAGDNLYASFCSGLMHGGDDTLQGFERQAFFQKK